MVSSFIRLAASPEWVNASSVGCLENFRFLVVPDAVDGLKWGGMPPPMARW